VNSSPIARLRSGWLWLALFAATLAAYGPALRGGFVWDDDGHVTRPELRSFHGLERIWVELGATQQYYPVLHSAFWLEHRLWGDSPLGYHLLNVLLHATAAGLLAVGLCQLAAGRAAPEVPPAAPRASAAAWAWLAAFLFALHPVGVESVAWVSEQKNTLSTVFYLAAALAYLRWNATPTGQRPLAPYLLASGLFLLAVLSKSVTATLPAALAVGLWWQTGRWSWKRDGLPLAPWFAVAAAAGLFTAWVERTYIGAQGAPFSLSLGQRFVLAGRIGWFYFGKLLWPAHLIFVYPRWTVATWPAWSAAFPLGLVLLLAGAWLARRRARGPLAALLFFFGSLFPALGFFNVYPFVFSYVADHFQYLASMGIFALVAGGWSRLGEKLRIPLALGLLLLLGVLTWRQSRSFHDMETLFSTTVERNPASWLAQENLGVVLANRGRPEEAVAHYQTALRLNPDFAESHANYGNLLAYQHRWSEAVAEYRTALRLRPNFGVAAGNWAQAEYGWASELGNSGRLPEAIDHYEQALRLRPNYPEARGELGLAEAYAGRTEEAVALLREAARAQPESARTHAYLGLALARSGRLAEAVPEYRASLRLNPSDREVHYQLGVALRRLGQTAAALDEFEAARPPRP